MSLIVELIGPSGVGKTHLVNRLRDAGRLQGWQSIREASALLESETPAPDMCGEYFQLKMLEEQISWFKANCPQHEVDLFMPVHEAYIRADILIEKSTRDFKILADEHLFHIFCGQVLNLAVNQREVLQRTLRNRAFIFVFDTAENILKNTRLRQQAGVWRPRMGGVGDDQLRERTEWYFSYMNQMAGMIAAENGRQIHLDLAGDESKLDSTVVNFLQALSSA